MRVAMMYEGLVMGNKVMEVAVVVGIVFDCSCCSSMLGCCLLVVTGLGKLSSKGILMVAILMFNLMFFFPQFSLHTVVVVVLVSFALLGSALLPMGDVMLPSEASMLGSIGLVKFACSVCSISIRILEALV